jgi:hypothetical protein
MTIGKKLMLAFGAMLALVLGLAYSSLSSTSSLGQELDTTVNVTAKKTDWIGQIDTATSDLRVGQRGVVLYSILKDPARVETANQMLSFAITPSARNKLTSKRMKANNRDTCQPFFCL